MKCHACAANIPDDAMFCSSCGTDVGAQAQRMPGTPGHEAALAAANLLRLRGRHAEAEARCIEVLRADPNNVHAHSMLGDIYLDQGRREDARQWYQLALDLDPNSRSDRRKLVELKSGGTPTRFGDDDETPQGLSPLTWVRFIGLALAVFMLGAGVAWVSRGRRHPTASVPPTAVSAPQLQIPRVDAGLSSRPPAETRDLPLEDQAEATDAGSGSDANLVEAEVATSDALVLSGRLSAATEVTAVVYNDDGKSAVVVLRHRPTDESRSEAVENQIAVDAVQAIHGVLQRAEQLARVDVVVRLATSTVGEYTALRARGDRRKLASNADVSSGERALRALTWYRWTPAWRSANPPSLESPSL